MKMNFKLKALVAALALAVTLPASAAMNTAVSGDSSLILTLLDNSVTSSATFDLGFNKSTFPQTTGAGLTGSFAGYQGTQWNISTGDYATAWTSFWAVATTATQYGVFAGDNMTAAVV